MQDQVSVNDLRTFPVSIDGRTIHVHGTAAQVEFTESSRFDSVDYRAWGTVVTSYDQLVWVHVSLPVAVDWTELLRSGRGTQELSTTTEIGASFDTEAGVAAVHLWDGPHRFAHWDRGRPEPASLDIGPTVLRWHVIHDIQRSLGLSIGIQYPGDFDPPPTASTFTLFAAYAVLA